MNTTQRPLQPAPARSRGRRLTLALGLTPLLLAACGGGGGTVTPTTPAATSLTLNGVRTVDDKTVQLGVSALDGSSLLRSGTFSDPSVTFTTAGVSGGATICGQIQVQDTVTAAVTLDATGSMASTDPGRQRQVAANAFVDRLSGASRAAVLSFEAGNTPSTGLLGSVLHQGMTGDKALLKAAITDATYEGSSTNFYDAVIDAANVAQSSGGPGPIVLALTDGVDNSSTNSAADAIAYAKARGVRVYAVGLDATSSIDFTELENIASQTGGLFQSNVNATDLAAYFDRLYNAVSAQGCVQINLAAPPAPGTVVGGTVSVRVQDAGKADAQLSVPFEFTAR